MSNPQCGDYLDSIHSNWGSRFWGDGEVVWCSSSNHRSFITDSLY